MDSSVPLLAQVIDDYVAWFAAWHRLTVGDRTAVIGPPASFAAWHKAAKRSSGGASQPAAEHVFVLHEQLHTLVKLVLMKAPDGAVEPQDDESITAKYLELVRELRRFERAFAIAAAGLDPLTGLRTRINLQNDLRREISRAARTGKPFFAAAMDIDHFKKINDTHGHEAGDRVLSAMANMISGSIRPYDDAYRTGGEEFLICLKDTDATGSLVVLERLRTGIEQTSVALTGGGNIRVTASFGIVACAKDATPDGLLREADKALYRAKNEGRNRVVTG